MNETKILEHVALMTRLNEQECVPKPRNRLARRSPTNTA